MEYISFLTNKKRVVHAFLMLLVVSGMVFPASFTPADNGFLSHQTAFAEGIGQEEEGHDQGSVEEESEEDAPEEESKEEASKEESQVEESDEDEGSQESQGDEKDQEAEEEESTDEESKEEESKESEETASVESDSTDEESKKESDKEEEEEGSQEESLFVQSSMKDLGPDYWECPLAPQGNRTIFEFPQDTLLTARRASANSVGPFSTTLPAGTYNLTFVSYEDHTGNPGEDPQLQEQWFLKAYNQNNDIFFESDAISDLAEDKDLLVELVQQNAVITQDITAVSAKHLLDPHGFGAGLTAESIHPLCVAFDKIEEEPETFKISGMKFEDKDKDGVKDAAEPGLEDWTITIEGSNNFAASTTTDVDGKYKFTDLEVGDYEVCETQQSGWNQTFPTSNNGCHEVTITNANVSNIDFGNAKKEVVLGECPLVPQADRIIVEFPKGTVLTARTASANSAGPFSANVPAGTYDITLVSFDDHTGNPNEAAQSKEQWFVRAHNASNTIFFSSDAISDLPENQDMLEELVQQNAVIAQDITNVSAKHLLNPHGFGAGLTAESIHPLCAAFDKVEEEPDTFAISGMKFEDADKDGVKDAGEPGLEDWQISIEGPNNFTDSTVTDANGNYEFSGLEAGDYEVCEVQQIGWSQTFPTTNNGCHEITIVDQDITDVDFGNAEEEADIIVEFTCTSVNVKSTKDLSNVVLQFEDGATQKFDGLSGKTGTFSGTGVHVGKVISIAWVKSGNNASGDGPGYGKKFVSNAVCEEPETFEISGMKFEDEDRDGNKDTTELGLQGWEITIEGPSAFSASTTTNASGTYEFTGLEAGDYEVCEIQQTGWDQTFPTNNNGCHDVTITNANVADIDFGNAKEDLDLLSCPLPQKDGRIIIDFTQGGTKERSDLVIRSDKDFGKAHRGPFMTAVPVGVYNITLASFDSHSEKANPQQPNERWKLELKDANIQEFAETSAISDLPDDKDFLVEVVDTDFTVSQKVEAVHATHSVFPDTSSANSVVPLCAAFDKVEEEPETFKISGMKFEDEDRDGTKDSTELGLQGWAITINGPNAFSASTTTNASGTYEFAGLEPGDYELCETQQVGWNQTFPTANNGCHEVTITNANVSNIDFGNAKKEVVLGECPLVPQADRIIVEFPKGTVLTARTASANSAGPFTANVPAGTYDITLVSFDDHTGNPNEAAQIQEQWFVRAHNASSTIFFSSNEISDLPEDEDVLVELVQQNVVIGQNITGLSAKHLLNPHGFGAGLTAESIHPLCVAFDKVEEEPDTFAISGMKFEDANEDAVKDATEIGLQGWEITITGPNAFSASTTTNASGTYEFTGLEAGDYEVCEIQQTGWDQTFPTSNNGCHDVTITNANVADIDFGNAEEGGGEPDTFSISGKKFNDQNGNGVDNSEPGLQGWVISITDGAGFSASTTTGANGNYSFTGLNPATYTLCETQQTDWDQTFPTSNNGCHEVVITNANAADIKFGNVQEEPPPPPGCVSNCGGGGGGPGSPTLVIEKTVAKEVVSRGEVVQYTVVVKNISGAVARNVVLTDVLPPNFSHQATNSTFQEWMLGDMGLNDEITTTFQVVVGQSASLGEHINVATVKADNHVPISDDARVRIVTGPPPTIPELPETGISFVQLAIWVNLFMLTLLLAVQVASFVVTGRMVFPRKLAFGNAGAVKSFVAAGVGTVGVVALLGVLAYPLVPLFASTPQEPTLVSSAEWAESIPVTEQENQLASEEAELEPATATAPANSLVIPKIGVQVAISEGADATALRHGAWRIPGTSTPVNGSNMALAAHRFRWAPPHEHTLYHLDKLQEGDLVQVFWQGKEYQYRMVSSSVVTPDALEVLSPTEKPTITLITCTPIFSVEYRLIVKAELVNVI